MLPEISNLGSVISCIFLIATCYPEQNITSLFWIVASMSV